MGDRLPASSMAPTTVPVVMASDPRGAQEQAETRPRKLALAMVLKSARVLRRVFGHATWQRVGHVLLLGGIVALISLHGLTPKTFRVDTTTVALVVIAVVVVLTPLLESATLPGGAGLVFRRHLRALAQETVTLEAEQVRDETPSDGQADEAVARRTPGEPDPADVADRVLAEASHSPKVALMMLSSELDRSVRHLLMGSGWGVQNPVSGLRAGVRRLQEIGVLSPSAASAVDLFTQVRNEVVHGSRRPSEDEILQAIDSGLQIVNAVAAVPRERNFVAATDVELFEDAEGTRPVTDATGLLLRTVGPGPRGQENTRIFPTTYEHRVGEEVAWVWNMSRTWGPTWYRHPDSGRIEHGWDSSAEFVGPPLD